MRQGLRPYTLYFATRSAMSGQSWRSLSPELGGVTPVWGGPNYVASPLGTLLLTRAPRTFLLNHTDQAHHQELMLLSVQLIHDHFFTTKRGVRIEPRRVGGKTILGLSPARASEFVGSTPRPGSPAPGNLCSFLTPLSQCTDSFRTLSSVVNPAI